VAPLPSAALGRGLQNRLIATAQSPGRNQKGAR
jgi:hypothetical protein